MKSQNIIVKILTIATILMVSSCKDQYIPKNQDSKTITDTYPALEELSTTLTNYTDNFIGTSPTRNGWNWVTAGLADYGGWGLGSKCGFWIGLGAGGFAGAPIGDIEEADKASLLISSSLVKKVLETILNNYETGLF